MTLGAGFSGNQLAGGLLLHNTSKHTPNPAAENSASLVTRLTSDLCSAV